MKGFSYVLSIGLGMAAGAVAVLMMPRQNPARRMASKAAAEVEDAVCEVSSRLMH